MPRNIVFYYFESHDWQEGVEGVKKKEEFYHGKRDESGGKIKRMSVINLHQPTKELKTELGISEYVYERTKGLMEGQAEVIKLNQVGFSVMTPKSYSFNIEPSQHLYLFKNTYASAILPDEAKNVVKFGKLEELKEYARGLLMTQGGDKHYFITGRNSHKIHKVFLSTKIVANTSRKTSDKQLVFPCYRHAIYGVAPN